MKLWIHIQELYQLFKELEAIASVRPISWNISSAVGGIAPPDKRASEPAAGRPAVRCALLNSVKHEWDAASSARAFLDVPIVERESMVSGPVNV